MADIESFSPIEDQLTTLLDGNDTDLADLHTQENSTEAANEPDSGIHVTLGDSASNPLSTFPLSDDETTEQLQASEDTEQAQDPEIPEID